MKFSPICIDDESEFFNCRHFINGKCNNYEAFVNCIEHFEDKVAQGKQAIKAYNEVKNQ